MLVYVKGMRALNLGPWVSLLARAQGRTCRSQKRSSRCRGQRLTPPPKPASRAPTRQGQAYIITMTPRRELPPYWSLVTRHHHRPATAPGAQDQGLEVVLRSEISRGRLEAERDV